MKISKLANQTIFLFLYSFYCKISGLNPNRTLASLLVLLQEETKLYPNELELLSDKVNKLRTETNLQEFYVVVDALGMSLDNTVGELSEKLEKRLSEWINQLN